MKKIFDVSRPYSSESLNDTDGKNSKKHPIKALVEYGWSCRPKNWTDCLVFLLALALLWQLLVSFGWLPSLTFPLVDKDQWQAVFLSNGQVYFGHLKEVRKGFVSLEEVYYLRSQDLPTSTQNQQQVNLVKLGNELHAPEDKMFIPTEQILFWENMKDDSPVVRVINQQKENL